VRASADRAGGNPDSKGNDTYRDGERERIIHDGLQRPVPVGSMPVRQQVSASTRACHSTWSSSPQRQQCRGLWSAFGW